MGQRFDLIEVMRFDAEDGIVELERHVARLGASARALGFAFNRHDARNELHAASFRLREDHLVRLALSRTGRIAIETRPLPVPPTGAVTVRIVPQPLEPDDLRLWHKTSDGSLYEAARRGAGTFEVLFRRPDGRLTDGSFTSLFVARGGRLATPPHADGLMPGILRQRLIDAGEAVEAPLTASDLANGFFVGNIVSGLLPARLG